MVVDTLTVTQLIGPWKKAKKRQKELQELSWVADLVLIWSKISELSQLTDRMSTSANLNHCLKIIDTKSVPLRHQLVLVLSR